MLLLHALPDPPLWEGTWGGGVWLCKVSALWPSVAMTGWGG